jgi:hypothetical protein
LRPPRDRRLAVTPPAFFQNADPRLATSIHAAARPIQAAAINILRWAGAAPAEIGSASNIFRAVCGQRSIGVDHKWRGLLIPPSKIKKSRPWLIGSRIRNVNTDMKAVTNLRRLYTGF